jgi:hypothetical protein
MRERAGVLHARLIACATILLHDRYILEKIAKEQTRHGLDR